MARYLCVKPSLHKIHCRSEADSTTLREVIALGSKVLLQHTLPSHCGVLVFLEKGVSSWQPRKKVISVHLCQGATCPRLEAAFVIYFCSFSVSFLSQGQGGCLFTRQLLSSVRLWSEQERWYLKAEDVKAC